MKARLIAVAAALLTTACSQLQIVGAGDAPEAGDRLAASEVAQCSNDSAAVLEGDRPEIDRTAGGQLQGPHQSFAGRPLTTVLAMDYSGSMYGGYERSEPSDKASACGWTRSSRGRSANGPYYWEQQGFRDLVQSGAMAGLGSDDPVHTLVFAKDIFALGPEGAVQFGERGFEAPLPSAATSAADAVSRVVTDKAGGSLPMPWSAPWKTPRMWSESHMATVLDAAAEIFRAEPGGDGILWIVTDNIIETSSNDDLSKEAELNRQFYLRLKEDPRWQVVYAYPVHQADWLCGSTLLVYGMYWSGHERISEPEYFQLTAGEGSRLAGPAQLSAFSALANQGSPAPGYPFKLKPDDMDLMRVSFERKIDCPRAKAGQARQCRATLTIENLLEHRRIEGAKLQLVSGRLDAWNRVKNTVVRVPTAKPLPEGQVTARVHVLEPIPPGGSKTVEVDLMVPPVETVEETLRDHWESANHERFLMLGSMTVNISELRTSMAVDPAQIGEIYGVSSLPEIFRNPNTSRLSATICMKMLVDNPAWLISLLLLGTLLLLILLALLGIWLLKPSFRVVAIDDVEVGRIRISRVMGATVEHRGTRYAKVRQRMGGSIRVIGIKPWRARPIGGHWELRDAESDMGERHRMELRRRSRPSQRGRAGDDF